MKRFLVSVTLLAGLLGAQTAAAQDEQSGEETMLVKRPIVGIDPGVPTNPSGSLSINNGYEPTRSDDWVFNFHGMLQLPLTFSVGPRHDQTKTINQSDTVFHSPAFYPGGSPSQFAWTGAIPQEYVQVAMTYGSTAVNGSVILDRVGIRDAFVTVDLSEALGQMIQVTVGSFPVRYGVMGEHDLGRYGTPLFVEVQQQGEVANVTFESGDMAFVVEQGFGIPGVDTNSPTVLTHLHGGFSYAHLLQLGVHWVDARNVSDRVVRGITPPAKFPSTSFIGGDLRLTAKQFGHLYLGAGKHTFTALNPSVGAYPPLPNTYKVLGARGARGEGSAPLDDILDNYIGTAAGGTGGLLVAGGQYDLSIGNLLYPELEGYGPDVFVSAFGMYAKSDSLDSSYDGLTQKKFGLEGTYQMLSWFGAGARLDIVEAVRQPVLEAPLSELPGPKKNDFQMLSPRVIFKSDWNSNDQLVLQYTRINYARGALASDSNGTPSTQVYQDENVITAYGMVWW